MRPHAVGHEVLEVDVLLHALPRDLRAAAVERAVHQHGRRIAHAVGNLRPVPEVEAQVVPKVRADAGDVRDPQLVRPIPRIPGALGEIEGADALVGLPIVAPVVEQREGVERGAEVAARDQVSGAPREGQGLAHRPRGRQGSGEAVVVVPEIVTADEESGLAAEPRPVELPCAPVALSRWVYRIKGVRGIEVVVPVGELKTPV